MLDSRQGRIVSIPRRVNGELYGSFLPGSLSNLQRALDGLIEFLPSRKWFDQNDVDHVTVMRVTWEGVPVGQEDVARRNWGEYYVRSIKTTFGFGTVL